MNPRDKFDQKLERKREQINARLDRQRDRINARFDRKQAEIAGKLNTKQELIISVALGLLKAEGLNSLSLREIAKQLDLQAPALYWHFKNKDALIDYMAEAILRKEFKDIPERRSDESWEEWLMAVMVRLRKAMLAYPDGGRVVAGAHFYPAVTLPTIMEASFEALVSGGLQLQEARRIVRTSIHYTFGHVIEEQASPTPEQMANLDAMDFIKPFPNLAKVMRAAASEGLSADDEYKIGLDYIIRGAQKR